jgi:alanyl-tRNA synthetase
MKTERLYYNDPMLMEFEALVVEAYPVDRGYAVILDRTAFYPTSGGQPNDLGAINDIPLLDCIDDENTGNVVHVLASPVAGRVHGVVDSIRRADHMQQHSGQHVLSQAFVELFGFPTLSFHLGVEACTIDLGADVVTRDQAAEAEALANRVVQDNRGVSILYFDDRTVSEAGLRKAAVKSGEIRVIDIAGYDKSACGGTHVRTTSEIGPILVTRLERAKKQTRVEFLCGSRVLKYAHRANHTLETISQIVSAPPLDAAIGVRNVWERLEEAKSRIEELELKLIAHEADAFQIKDGKAMAAFKNRGIESLKLLASRVCVRPSVVAIFVDESEQTRLVIARSADLTTDAAAVLKKVLERFGGRGGGRPSIAQGGGLTGTSEEILEYAGNLAVMGSGSV